MTADAPVIDAVSPAFSSNINTTALDNIPVNNRRWSALALMTPGVTVDTSGFGLVSIRGISPILNNVMIDGADDNQAYFAEERGRTREAYSTSASAVREFEVNAGVYPAEFGRAAGGVINSVTKSGTNELHGELYFWDRESNWSAYNAQSTVTNFVNGKNVTTPFKPEDVRKIYGFTAGGALIKDKLFWMYTYDQHSHIFPMLGVPNNPAVFYATPDALGGTGDTACNSTGYLPTTTNGVTNSTHSGRLQQRRRYGHHPAGRLQQLLPARVIVDDMRVGKEFAFHEQYRLQLFAQAFNIANHQNVSAVSTTAYTLSGATATFQPTFGEVTKTNNSGFSYTPRQIELSARLSF